MTLKTVFLKHVWISISMLFLCFSVHSQTITMYFPTFGGIDNCANPLPNAGNYTVTGTFNGKNEYTKPGGNPRIRWANNRWEWQADDPTIGGINFLTCWYNTNNTATPPAECWKASFGCFLPAFSGAITETSSSITVVPSISNVAGAGTVNFTVTFSSAMSYLYASNFTLTTTGTITGAAITSVSKTSAAVWNVAVNSGTGNGSITLNLNNLTGTGAITCATLPVVSSPYIINNTTIPVTLSAGDIAFTAYNSSSTTMDDFSFIVLKNGGIPAGTKIYFTDDGYGIAALKPGEGLLLWEATANMAQFDQVSISSTISSASYTATAGSVLAIPHSTNLASINLSSSGDQLFALQGSTVSPSFLTGIQMNTEAGTSPTTVNSTLGGWDNFTSGTTPWTVSTSRSAIPPSLTNGVNAVMVVIGTNEPYIEFDNAIYNCTGATSAASLTALRSAINNRANWTLANAPTFTTPPTCSFSMCSAPIITTAASSNSPICAGGVLNLNVAASGTSLTYSWTGTGTFTNGTTANPMVINPTNGNYVVTVSNNCGSVTSTATVTVNPNVGTPSFSSGSTVLCIGGTSTYTATASNSTSIIYSIVGGVGASIDANSGIVSNVTASFTVRANAFGTCGSSFVDRAVVVSNPPTIAISASPSTTICAGSSILFTATPTNGGTTVAYQWKVNNVNVGNNSPNFTSSTLANGDMITCVMTGNALCGTPTTATSNAITITVNPLITPSVSIAASATTVCAGTNVTFTATPTNGGTTPSYQWKKNNVNVGTNSSTYSDNGLTNGASITCLLTSNAACLTSAIGTSNPIAMTVNPLLTPAVSIATTTPTICAGSTATFTATPTNGGTTPTYQWKKNNVNVGTNSPTYTATGLINNDAISCAMTSNATCASPTTATSSNINMVVNPLLTPSVSIAASATNIISGTSVTFTATPTNGGTNPTYQWKKNNVNVGTNASTYSDASLANNDAITCVLTSNETCVTSVTATSSGITMTVLPAIADAINMDGTNDYVALPNSLATSLTASTNPAITIEYWFKGSNIQSAVRFGDATNYIVAGWGATGPKHAISTDGGTAAGIDVGAAAIDGNWHHVAMTWQKNTPNGFKSYLDGVLVAQRNSANANLPAISTSTYLGALGGTSEFTNGSIDEVRIWNRALEQCEIQNNRTCELAPAQIGGTSGLLAYYQFHQGLTNTNNPSVTTVTDASGNAYNGTLYGFGLTGLSSNWVAPGGVTSGVSCTPLATPSSVSIAITSGNQKIIIGTSVTFTATPVNAGASPTYQWTKNGINVGTNSATYTDAGLSNNDVIMCTIPNNNGVCPITVSSNQITMNVSIIRYVKTVASGTGDGSSWANASSDLQGMINAPSTNEVWVWVAAGTYIPTLDPLGVSNPTDTRTKTFQLKNGVKVYGGFAGTEVLPSDRTLATIAANPTILSGDFNNNDVIAGSGSTLSLTGNAENAYHVLISVANDNSALIDGFIVKGGNANGNTLIFIGLNYLINGHGGGMYNQASAPTIQNMTFIANSGGVGGGGIYNSNGSLSLISNCAFVLNYGGAQGGGVLNYANSNATINSCVFYGNYAFWGGGLLNTSTASPTISNCTFYGNHGYLNGGGIYSESNSSPTIKNAVIWGNTSPGGTSGIVNSTATSTVTYSNVQGTGVYAGIGNLNIEPLLYYPGDVDGADNIWRTADDGLRLGCLSPSYNTGTNTGAPTLDILDNPLFGANKDMGAYESQYDLSPTAIPTISASSATSVCTGANVTLTATGNGGTATQFSWFKNGVFSTYTLTPNYTLPALLGTNKYSVVVIYNGCPSIRSTEIDVTGNTPVAVITPSIPASIPYCVGSAPTLDATPPTGSGYTYSWICTACGTTTTGATYTPTSSGQYKVVVTDANGCKNTSYPNTTITLNGLPNANAGADKFPCVDSAATLGITPTVGNTYQWTPSTNLSNATISNPKVTLPTTGTITYTLTVTNASGCSKADQVDVSPIAPPAPPTLSSSASSVCQTQSITLTPSTTGSIYWYKNGAVFGGLVASAVPKPFSTVTASPDVYTIRAVGAGSCKSLPSNSQSVMVNAAPAVTLSSNPGPVGSTVSVCNPGNTSGTADLSVVLPSGAPAVLSYNWQVGGVNVVPAATGALYTAPVSIAANNKVYRAQVTYAGNCTVTSPNMTVKMLPSTCTLSSVSIAITSGSQSTCTGSSVTFTATPLNATNTPIYQWKKNNVNVGTNAATYTDVGLVNGDIITCTMTDGSIVVSSNSLTMTVNTPVTPTLSIAITTGSQSILYGTSVTFTATSTNGGTSPSYQWKKNNVNVGANSATYTDAALLNNDVITCVMTSNAPCPTPTTVTSNSFSMAVTMPGAALNFDGVDDYVNLGTTIPNVTTFTLETWVNPGTGYGSFSDPAQPVEVISRFGAGGVGNAAYRLGIKSSGKAEFYVYNASTGASAVQSNLIIPVNTWTHIAATRTADNTMNLYINGVLDATISGTITPQVSNYPIYLGSPIAGPNKYKGNIDEVRIWSRALSQCEIQSRMNCELASGQSGLSAYYKFNQGFENSNNTAITSLTDASGNSGNGTLMGFGLTSASSNWIAGGGVTTGTTCVLSPSITITATATTITPGTNVTFTATPTNGGTSPSYQWKKNNVNVGTNSVTYTDATLVNNDIITCEMTSATPCPTITSNSLTIAGIMPGAALNFDGVDDYVDLGTAIPNLTTFTLEAWVKPGAGYGSFGDTGQPVEVISRFGAGGAGNAAYRLGIKLSGKAEFYVYNASTGASAVQSALTIPINTWTHIAATRTVDNTMNIYINGVLDATISGTITPQTSNYPIYLGRPISGVNRYNGGIDEVRIWSRALSQCEIQSRMNCELASGQNCLLGYYKFNQGLENSNNSAVTSLTDASGNGVDGTLVGFGLTGAISNWIAAGGVTTGTTCASNPSITISASATTITTGTNVTFTATASNAGTTPIYQWKKNGANVGSNLNTYTDASLIQGDEIACIIKTGTCLNSPAKASNVLTMNVSAPSVVRYVKPTASGTGDGSSWANASADLQAMINVAGVQQVWVAAGTYKPTTTTNRSIPFTPKSNVGIYGGFAGTETTLCERNVAANVTTLSGDIGTIGVRTDNSYTIINAPAVTNAILDGFTIRDGQDDLSAGPVRIDNNGSMSFVNCTFRDNVGYLTNHLRGTNSTVYLVKCKFSNSVRIAATDVASTTSTFYILDCFFTNSTGGAFGNGGTATVNNSVFTGINASLNNGGIFSNNGVIDISNCTVTNNSAYLNAGGYASSGSTFTVRNSIFWNNPSGHGLSLNGPYTITYSNIQGGVAGEGNVNVNPSFVSTTNIAGADGVLGTSDDGLIPQATSTCTENLLTIPYSAKDITGFVVTSSAKMGAYSVSPCANPAIYTLSGGGNYCSGGNGVPIALSNSQTGTSYQLYVCSDPIGSAVTGTGAALNFGSPTTAGTYTVIATNTAGGCSSTMLGTAYVQSCGGSRLVQNPKEEDFVQETFSAYPNPTEGSLVVNIQNSTATEGKLVLYNPLGQVLISRSIRLSNGASEESFDLSELASGVYTLSFQTENGSKIQKVVKE